MIARFVQEGRSIDHTPAAAVSAGDVIVVGNLLGIAKLDIAANALGALALDGVFDVSKPGTEAWTFGQRLYWDAANSVFTSTNTGVSAGVAAAAAEETAVLGQLILNAVPLVPVEGTSVELTDSTGGTASATDVLVDVGATYAQAEVANNFATLARELAALRADMVSAGVLIA